MTARKGLPKGFDRLPSGTIRGRYVDADGRTQPGQFPAETPNRDLVAWLREQQVAVARGTHVAAADGRVTFEEYATERAAAWRRHKPATRALVESHLRNHAFPGFGARPIGSIRVAEVEAWVARTEQVLAPATVHVVFAWVRRVFADAHRQRMIRENPCEGIELPERPKREVVPLPLDAVDAVTDAMPEHLRATVLVAAWSGLRQGEVLGLRRHRLDLLGRHGERGSRAASLYVAEALQTLKGPPVLVTPKTKGSVRRVPIPGVVVQTLAAHLAEYPTDPQGFVFRNTAGRPLRRNSFGATWAKAVAEAGLPKGTRFHDLRHTYASMLIEAGESVTVVSKRMGHASATETLDTYSHLWADNEGRTVQVLDAAYKRHMAGAVTSLSREET